MSSTLLFLDIETLPDLWLDEEGLKATLEAKVPKSIKKPETRAKWLAENAEKVRLLGSLDRYRGLTHIICWALDSDPEDVVRTHLCEYQGPFDEGGTEADYRKAEEGLLSGFEGALPDAARYATWVSYGGNHFDLPWLALRAIRYGLPLLGRALPTDKWGKQSLDLMETVKLTDYRGSIPSASKVGSFILGTSAETDEGSSGKDVYPNWQNDDVEASVEHCRNDVIRLRQLHARMRHVGVV